MTEAYIGIGSNLGDRRQYIKDAIRMLRESPDIKIDKASPLYETDPAGGPPQGRFLNGVLRLKTDLSPRQLLKRLNEIEDSLGRERTVKDGPRTIDLDILTYGDLHIEEEDLVIPHPRMERRDFVKRPLNDILDIR
ncbi:MAG: 2-amino-4-hydroxy-6-hydroxymethyldihydropteridine diphosphokinase [Candidatus Omnitrophica bacterium]|nr:2-amino-4-hydroxy-6-hydroxymethyldihydropteridine diphosphokinase [Candidatus Omnitrophota bacterium]